MEKLIKWIEKNSAEGADIQEAKKLVEDVAVSIQSREDADKFIESNKFVKAELDSKISKSVENAIERFKETKLPSMLESEKEKIRKELNPEETPEQKRIRELEQKIQAQEERENNESRKSYLRNKAKEINFDPIRAERYSVYGDDAEKILLEDVEFFQTHIKTQVETELKNKYGNKPPVVGSQRTMTPRAEVEDNYKKALQTGDGTKAFMLKEQLAKMPVDELN